ncbi:MAG: type I-A CRISPR-associated protein Cas4/Csa1 [Candidatus Aquicultor secundus]|uniref:Type I-A CRISPR-associated protein Cas4/Csa1 n=1 Tax=Candidatus Aquicultor secundus TaxID=1973895 RepID=A0A2M7T7X8_9ACTN|nr:type I-A CRISPR-associated protein Cas4/Csa1 [Candidatus Aquicultor secundus]NCO66654.1 type I-A CRISPR-associated protein Cas4/Csa1 [Solirubrobacter sp.]OIO85830.1 MAG: type I-A CRISPR-associated protein Cas4/Csa1 [Candidatus Aquicultor secundus]PIU26100.1 MAG: type I-A CRISPR-associated protein Cas4/Csa1 [Candidatus Aquicultor secundus]PIW22537.1 MAG: type I-A CRISPR-associated protein Cas4/Csa1 [Candidatus Aquicultor secundus]PIX51792.1 MAG: type I-A CRISPR-associated protein Cas4/Csa1 [
MYFPTEEERKDLTRGLLPKARKMVVADELRGWNWNMPPLEPIYDIKLALYEVAGYYCATARDLYMKRVQGIEVQPNIAMMFGGILHAALAKLIIEAKRAIYTTDVSLAANALEELRDPDYSALDRAATDLNQDELTELKNRIAVVWRHQLNAIITQVDTVLSKQPRLGVDSLVALAIPVSVEHNLDGSFLGLSSHLSTDAYRYYETTILDLKFGEPSDFHRLTTAGYALVMESLYEYPVNLGCIIYARFDNGRLLVDKDYHLIDDELRQWFIEARDEKMRMVSEEIDPGMPDECYEGCPYTGDCSR